jgi:hypothetical protein
MGHFTPPFSERQIKATAIVPKVFSFPAILGSLFIIQHILRSKKRRSRVYHRILLWMSVHDFIYSIKSFLSTWPIPDGTNFVYGAKGNTQTCATAGFLGHAGALTSIFYNGSLTVFFLMVVRFGWKEDYIKRKVEPWLHGIPLLFGWSTAIAGIPLQLYNAFGWTCWINTYPPGCTDNVDCLRGDNAGIYRWAFFHAELWAIYGFTIVAMFLIYFQVLKQEKVMKRYAFRSTSEYGVETTTSKKHRKRSTQFAHQAMLYVIIFFFTWFFPMLQTLFGVTRDDLYYPLILLSSMLSSMQGFSNAVIYLRPRWTRFRKFNPDIPFWTLVWIALTAGEEKSAVCQLSRSNQGGVNTFSPSSDGIHQQKNSDNQALESAPTTSEFDTTAGATTSSDAVPKGADASSTPPQEESRGSDITIEINMTENQDLDEDDEDYL